MPLSITPGPWHHQPSAGGHHQLVYDEKDGATLAVLHETYGGKAEMEANARAIAALPELLAFAVLVVNDCEGKPHPTPLERSLAVNARATLRKAGAL